MTSHDFAFICTPFSQPFSVWPMSHDMEYGTEPGTWTERTMTKKPLATRKPIRPTAGM